MQSNPTDYLLQSVLMKYSIKKTFCNSTKSYLSPFSKLPKGDGALHAMHFYFRGFFWILQVVADTLLHSAKKN
jgi:hypothetical protein